MIESVCNYPSNTILQLACGIFLAILFLQSGLDKVFDHKGNLEFLTKHFANSPLAKLTLPMFYVIMLMETATGVFNAAGVIQILIGKCGIALYYGAIGAALSIIALFFGQRVAKDYTGAQSLVSYFIVALIAIYLNT